MRYLIWITMMHIAATSIAQQTVFELLGGTSTATYFEAVDWYQKLDKKSSILGVKTMGQTDAGYPLHLVMISNDGSADPVKWHQQKKVVILINNGIHPGEPDGIDASMMLARDIVNKKLLLPNNIALAIIPVYNIGGSLNRNSYTRANQNGPVEYGFRGNAQNLDLNRDFTKSDSKNARSFAEIFHFLNPDILIDNHVSDGADFQHTMTLIATQYDKLGQSLGSFLRDEFEPQLYKGMSAKGWDMIPYVDFGYTDFNKGMRMFMEPPRYSSGYAALFNTLSFMPETHMLKPYEDRVRSTYDLMQTFIEQSALKASAIKSNRADGIKEWMNRSMYPLRWKADSTRFSIIDFKGYEMTKAMSEATGLEKMVYDHDKPYNKKVKFLHAFTEDALVKKPKAYVIPAGWWAVLDLLQLNKVAMSRLSKDTMIEVTAYRIEDYKPATRAYEKHHKNASVKTSSKTTLIGFKKGDCIVYLNQLYNRYLVEMLEPTGDDSFFSWNFFDGILQQKEGYSDYRWEDIAAEVLKKDSTLQKQLEEKKRNDPPFAKNASAILDFIYKNSSYYEKAYLQYPIYRIEY
ncbi:MAG: M14 family metallopeptidase [Ferruginibacter sp.]